VTREPQPIACSLGTAGAADQAAAWRALLGRAAVTTERRAPTRVDWTLGDDDGDLLELVRLARAEKACCPFLELRFVVEADGLHLQITAPPEAGPLLDELAGP
jgi:MerR family copper efflux transcriptional regulator